MKVTVYRVYQFVIALPLFILVTFVTSIVMMTCGAVGCKSLGGYWPARVYGWLVCRIFLLPVKVEGRANLPKNTQCIYIANHQGAFDIFLVLGYLHRPFRWVMKVGLSRIPFFGWACKSCGYVMADNSTSAGVRKTYADAREVLMGGSSLALFPEGRRSWTGEMGKFHKSAFLLAREFQIPLVPITINGSFKTLPRSSGFGFVGMSHLSLTIHPMILAPDPDATTQEIEEMTQRTHGIIEAAIRR